MALSLQKTLNVGLIFCTFMIFLKFVFANDNTLNQFYFSNYLLNIELNKWTLLNCYIFDILRWVWFFNSTLYGYSPIPIFSFVMSSYYLIAVSNWTLSSFPESFYKILGGILYKGGFACLPLPNLDCGLIILFLPSPLRFRDQCVGFRFY